MPTLGERIDLILAYGVEGNDDLKSLSENLENSGDATERLLKQEKQLSKSQSKTAGQFDDVSKAIRSQRERRLGLNQAMEEAQKIMQDNALRLENLKLEYEDGNITTNEYASHLQTLRDQLERLDVPSVQLTRRIRQLSAEQSKAFNTMSRGQGNVRGATTAFTSMFQILQDLPFGFTAIANNIPFATEQLAHFSNSAKGSGGVMKGLIGFLSGPAGIAIAIGSLIPLLAMADQKFDIFKTTLFDVKKVAKEVADAIGDQVTELSELEGVNVGKSLQNQLDNIDKVLEEFEQSKAFDPNWFQSAVINAVAFVDQTGLMGASARGVNTLIKQDEKVIANLQETRADIQAKLIAQQKLQESQTFIELRRKRQLLEVEKIRNEELQEMLEGLREREDFVFDTDFGDLEEGLGLDRMMKEAQAFAQFESKIQNLSERVMMQVGDTQTQIAIQQKRELDEINRKREENLISAQQHERAYTNIVEFYANKRANAISQEEAKKRQMRQQTTDMAFQLLGALNGFGQVIHGQSEERAKKAFEVNKKLQLAMAIASGARAVVEALPNLKLAMLAGAISAVNIAKIASTKFGGGGSGASSGGGQSFSYRGFDQQAETPSVPETTVNVPDTFKIVDEKGELLTKLEQARARSGGSPNLVE